MKKPILFILVLILSITGFSQTALQYNLNVGDSFAIRQDSEQIITQDISGGQQIITNDISAEMSFIVTKIENSLFYIEMKYQTLKMKTSSPSLGVLMDMDTSITPDSTDVQGRIFQGLINSPVTMVMQKNGKINALEGTETLIDNMIKNAGITDPNAIKQVRISLDQQWGDNQLLGNFEQMTYIYGDNNATAGDKWENEYTGKMKSKNKWNIASIMDESATIAGTSEIEMENTNASATIIVSGSQKAMITVNNKTGLMQEGSSEGICKGNTLISTMPDTKIPTSIKFKNNYKTIK
ncbi:hypothetical protein IWQ47_002011 [Aquimarina sp. EL_43]|uniref:DUF6263 family protein n=1 Tax=unclassified Aquimarina TaxID=2627091 RepID=UPI0018C9708C|nr:MULTISPECIES: DUF6263 family protein [unclassified Aquimarina]MBG6130535.1 hypothetical protein [Aquimarina sp. EL_35]MBG6151319.1 hypothetical protein [Aquimarina sp. EL_32]MBG6168937.1 hypothetical protein [Aquimarina sp. EL_43]